MLLALSYVARSIFYLFFRRNKNEFVSGIRGDPRCAISCVLGGPQKLVRKLNRQNFWGEIFGEEWHMSSSSFFGECLMLVLHCWYCLGEACLVSVSFLIDEETDGLLSLPITDEILSVL